MARGQRIESVSERQLDLFGNEQGKEMLIQAMKWRNENLRAWSEMCRIACERARQGKRVSIALLAEEARYAMRIKGGEMGFKINNSYRAPLARLMAQEYPNLKDFLEMRESKVDTWI